MNDSTALAAEPGRRRGRHAAAPTRTPQPIRPSPAPQRPHRSVGDDTFRLPGMELLGFYDEPYRIRSEQARPVYQAPGRVPVTRLPLSPATSLGQPGGSAGPSQPRQALVSELWDTTTLDAHVLDWWKPGIIARSKLGGGRLRLATIVAVLLTTAVLSGLLWVILERPQHVEDRLQSTITSDLGSVRSALPDLTALAGALGKPETPDLAAATSTSLTAEAAARSLFSHVADVSDSTDPFRQTAVETASKVLDGAGRINQLVAYRLVAERVLTAPQLPTSPTPADIGAATAAMADWRSQVSNTLLELPDDVLADHAARLAAWESELQTWQESYLNAVLLEDEQALAAAVKAQKERIADLRTELLDRLATAGAAIETDLASAGSGLDSLLGA